MSDILKRIDEKLDEMNKSEMKADFMKALKVINSVQNKGQAEVARKYIEAFYDKWSMDMEPFKKLDLMVDRGELLRGLKDHMMKKHGVKITDRELGLL